MFKLNNNINNNLGIPEYLHKICVITTDHCNYIFRAAVALVACRSFSLWQTKGRLRQSKAGLRQTKGRLRQSKAGLRQTKGRLRQSKAGLRQTKGIPEGKMASLHCVYRLSPEPFLFREAFLSEAHTCGLEYTCGLRHIPSVHTYKYCICYD